MSILPECLAGDLAEEFLLVSQSRGLSEAWRWYVWQVLRSLGPLLTMRVRSGELTGLVVRSAAVGAVLFFLDRLWTFVYSQIPLKDGLQRDPVFLGVNVLCVAFCAYAGKANPILSATLVAIVTAFSPARPPAVYFIALIVALTMAAFRASYFRRTS